MAVIPLNQRVVYTPVTRDDWGDTAPGTPVELPARVTEEAELVRNQAGEEVLTNLRIILDGLADVDYDGEFEYTNELGATVRRQAQAIKVVRGIGGEAWLTVVSL